MSVFNKKDTLTKSISFMALMAAINIVLSLLTAFVPFLSVVLVIFLPLTSALVEVTCKDKYFSIYALGTVGLSIAVTFWNIDFTIFYVVPSIITGYIFGLMCKKNISPIWSILTATLAQTIISILFVPLIELFTERNIIIDISTLFGFSSIEPIKDYTLLILFVVSLVQIILSYIAVYYDLKKLGFELKEIDKFSDVVSYGIFVTILLSIITFLFYKNVSILFIAISMYFAFFVFYKFISEHDVHKLIISGVLIFLNIFVYAVFNPLLNDASILLIQFSPLTIGILNLLKL